MYYKLNGRRMFINVQLFGEDANVDNDNIDKGNDKSKDEDNKFVSKELFDKTSSELASLKRQLKEIQNKGKTAEQLKDDAIAEKDQKLKELTIKLNKASAGSIISESKAKINFEANDDSIDSFIDTLINEDEEITKQNAIAFNKLLLAVYNKGVNDTTKNVRSNTGNNTRTGSDSNKEMSVGERIAKNNKSSNRDSVLKYY